MNGTITLLIAYSHPLGRNATVSFTSEQLDFEAFETEQISQVIT